MRVTPYRYPYCQKIEIKKIVRELLEYRVIRPSQSPFSSPVLLVRKEDGSWRMCIDYLPLNKETIEDKYLIPVVGESHGSTIFSKMHLQSGYHQLRIRKKDISRSPVVIQQKKKKGRRIFIRLLFVLMKVYEFLVMPFGLTNAHLLPSS